MSNPGPHLDGASASSIRLADLDQDLLWPLTEAEQEETKRVSLPVVAVSERTPDLGMLLRSANAFGAIVLEGMLQHHMRISEQPGLRLLGPGDIAAAGAAPSPMVLAGSDWRATARTRIVLLGEEFLVAVKRWPGLVASLQVRMAEQIERLSTQLAICQQPRVEDRVLAMLWLLAETWGRVTPTGTTLPLSLTHEALGALVGARRPTVTLALGGLAERGAVVHQDRGWLLLLEPPAQAVGEIPDIDAPRVLDDGPSDWSAGVEQTPGYRDAGAELADTVNRLRSEHLRNTEEVRNHLRRMIAARARTEEVRARVRDERALRRRREQPPSS